MLVNIRGSWQRAQGVVQEEVNYFKTTAVGVRVSTVSKVLT